MKTLLFIFCTLLVWPRASQADDCVTCPAFEMVNTMLEGVGMKELSQVVAPLVTIRKPVLKRNPKAEYCVRNESMVDTIVFHHSGGPSDASIEDINDGHVERRSSGNPWLMLGYHYAINAPYPGARGSIGVSQGRPFNITGAHVGTDIFATASKNTKLILGKEGNLRCGIQGGKFKTPPDRFNSKGQAKGNYTTVGVVLIGNYAQYSASNPDGYPRGKPRYLSESAVDQAGRLACDIQRRHPRVTKITWHSTYHPTECPGTIRQSIQRIKQSAARFGCKFN